MARPGTGEDLGEDPSRLGNISDAATRGAPARRGRAGEHGVLGRVPVALALRPGSVSSPPPEPRRVPEHYPCAVRHARLRTASIIPFRQFHRRFRQSRAGPDAVWPLAGRVRRAGGGVRGRSAPSRSAAVERSPEDLFPFSYRIRFQRRAARGGPRLQDRVVSKHGQRRSLAVALRGLTQRRVPSHNPRVRLPERGDVLRA